MVLRVQLRVVPSASGQNVSSWLGYGRSVSWLQQAAPGIAAVLA
jgi:hypothetical protein